jgi:hypothetical protein
MIDRRVFENGVHTGEVDVDWMFLRRQRNKELARTDYWALKDLTMSQDKKDYRIFLRNLPQNFVSANDACDAWAAYDIPEASP